MLLLIRSVFTWWASASVSSGSMSLSITSSGIDPEDTCGLIIQHDNWSWDPSVITDIIVTDHRNYLGVVGKGHENCFWKHSIRLREEACLLNLPGTSAHHDCGGVEWFGVWRIEYEEEHKEEEEDDRGQGRPTVNLSKTFSDSWFRHHPAPQWKFQLAPRTHCSLWKYQYQNDMKRYYPTAQSGLMCFWQLSQLSLTNGSIPLCTDQSKYSVKRMDSFKYI